MVKLYLGAMDINAVSVECSLTCLSHVDPIEADNCLLCRVELS